MVYVYKRTTTTGEIFWVDFVTEIRAHQIRNWHRPTITEFWELLTTRGIHVEGGRNV